MIISDDTNAVTIPISRIASSVWRKGQAEFHELQEACAKHDRDREERR